MAEPRNDLLIKAVERYMFHKNYETDNPIVADIRDKICDVELAEIWMLTQK